MKMGAVLPIREGVDVAPAEVTDVIGQACRRANAGCVIGYSITPHQRARTILLNSIMDSAARGLRDVDQLCEEALAELRKNNEA